MGPSTTMHIHSHSLYFTLQETKTQRCKDLAKVIQILEEEPGWEPSVSEEARPSQHCLGDNQTTGERAGRKEEQWGQEAGKKEDCGDGLYRQGLQAGISMAEWEYGYLSTSSNSFGRPCV